TRTVTRGTDDIPSILYIYLLETCTASTVNRLVRPSLPTAGVPDERPDHYEWRGEQQVERPQNQRGRDQLEGIRDVFRLRVRVRPLDRIVARTRHAPGVVRAVARYVEVFEISADVGVNVERDQRPRRGVRGPGPDEDVAGSDREAEGREIRMEGGVRAAHRRQHELAVRRHDAASGPVGGDRGSHRCRVNQDRQDEPDAPRSAPSGQGDVEGREEVEAVETGDARLHTRRPGLRHRQCREE